MGKPPKNGRAKPATPWDSANVRVPKHFSTKFDEVLHMQMIWLCENVPQTSIQKLVQRGTRDLVAKLLKEHYKQ